MKRFNPGSFATILALGISSMVLVTVSPAAAQAVPPKKVPVKPAPVKPAAAPTKPVARQVTPVAKTATPVAPAAKPGAVTPTTGASPTAAGMQSAPTQGTAAGAVVPASSQNMLPAATAARSGTAMAPTGSSSLVSGRSVPGAQPASAVAGDPRAAVATQGLGTFLGGGWTMTVYGCFRTGTRVLCDFDVLPPYNLQIGAGAFGPWVALVDNGGKITRPHNAFFQAADGSQLNVAYASTDSPLRLLMEYDDVAANFTSVSLVHGTDKIAGVPVTPADPNLPAGAIQARAAAPAAGTDSSNAVDKASNGLTTATGKIQDTKDKTKTLLQQLKDTGNAIKH